jgi:hypothetical protein
MREQSTPIRGLVTKGLWLLQHIRAERVPHTSATLGVIRSGHLLFVSGVGGWYPSRRRKGDIQQQTADALEPQ